MTEKEKAKAYDEAIERAKKLYGNGITEEIFHELKEDDTERIRKNCIHFLELQKQHHAATVEIEECIDWLEKQGENSTDKIEPIFKVGDWVASNLSNSSNVLCIIGVDETNYEVVTTQGSTGVPSIRYIDKHYHLWSIQDAKDGDVLACNEEILLFKSYSAQVRISLYCWYNWQTNNFHSKEVNDVSLNIRNKILPAAKEQRDALMKAMNEAGYAWDEEKKELKKFEPEVSDKQDKFDSKTLQTFDKVLVRNYHSYEWKCTIFSHIRSDNAYPYMCIDAAWRYCIPYNDDTIHLVGITEDAPDYYKYWEE